MVERQLQTMLHIDLLLKRSLARPKTGRGSSGWLGWYAGRAVVILEVAER
jgi:hypothetical protein